MNKKHLDELKEQISLMARRAESIFDKALEVLRDAHHDRFQDVLLMDRDLNKMEMELDQSCIRLLALKDPFAVDLRFILSVMKSVRDLERIGDESKTIAKWSVKLPADFMSSDLSHLIDNARKALQLAIQALLHDDEAAANECLQVEEYVDEYEDRVLLTDPALPLGLITRSLERIGDLSSNISENVIYYLEAKDIRHQEEQQQQ
ncbi:phosphate signaling complex protein PhoU [Leptonema illini]|uniref:Phosphate uptake regulator, PhoU n=1 Tax=Leptonema illini DSM 21528 TaxID=929563 RepID=H2CEI0_9LEPT|nr:phosphate signaling complex protein PhoU [Leptonema illini]EHQ05566.1 phosphate uptake regulator, PhoU [Leptonema illini DSM 21528]